MYLALISFNKKVISNDLMTTGFVQLPTKASVKEANRVFIMNSFLSIDFYYIK